MLVKVYSLNAAVYFHHCPKSSCPFCRKEGRKYVKEPTYYIAPHQAFEFEHDRKQCDYHEVVNFLRNSQGIQFGQL